MAQISDISLELKREARRVTSSDRLSRSVPDCNKILPAIIFEREGKVFMTKTCPQHGETEELYFGSYEMFAKFSRYWKDGKGTHAAERPHGRLLVPRQLRALLEPPLAHRPLQHHRHEPLRPDLLVLLLLRQEGPRGRLRLRAHPRPGPRDGPHAQGGAARPRQLGPDHRRRAHHQGRPARDNQDNEGGGRRPHPAQHQRHQPRARARRWPRG